MIDTNPSGDILGFIVALVLLCWAVLKLAIGYKNNKKYRK